MNESAGQPADNSEEVAVQQQPRSRRFRWKAGLVLLAIGAIAQFIQWNINAEDRTMQIFISYVIVPATVLAMTIWWVFFSGVAWMIRIAGVAVVALVLVGVLSQLRFDGFNGDMMPRFALATRPVAEQAAAEMWKDLPEQELLPVDESPDNGTDAESASTVATWDVGPTDWPDYRGPRRDGVVTTITLNPDWDTAPPQEIWKQPIGLGWSSYAIVDDFAWTQEQVGSEEIVSCYRLKTGAPLWKHGNAKVRFSEAMGGDGPRATPVFHEGRIYALGATGILDCLDARTGQLFWTRNILEDAEADNIDWGMAATPLILEGRVIVNPGGKDGKSVAAYDALTGEIVWQTGDHAASYTAPRVVTLDGVEQVLVFDGEGLGSYLAADGTQLWFFPWTTGPKVNAAQPIPLDDHSVVIGTGYSVGGTKLNISQSEGKWDVTSDWTSRDLKWKFNAAVQQGNYAYGLDDGILACVDLTTGKRQWKRGRYGFGQLLLIGEHLLVLSEKGELVLLAADPERFEELAKIPAIDGKTWNHPAISGDLLLIRNAEQAACFRLATK